MEYEKVYFNNDEILILYTNEEMNTPSTYISELKTIIVNENLSSQEREKVILHELGHYFNHSNESDLYCATSVSRMKMEYEANKYMIDKEIDRYVSKNNVDPSTINYVDFAESHHFTNTHLVKSLILDKINKADNI